MSDPHFYRDLPPFHSFVDEAFDPSHYVPVPSEWLLVVADITGSTRAVETGKYAEVNYLGAACIVAVSNALPQYVLPTVFGGDGATMAIPPQAQSVALEALLATQSWGRRAFGLDLRVGIVPVAEIERRGAAIQVAKMQFSPGNHMAMFRGDGFDLADALVKGGDGERSFEVVIEADRQMPDLESLSCRWSPMASEHGHMLCLIIGARAVDTAAADAIYREVLERINGIVALNCTDASPVKLSAMRFRLRLEAMGKEVKSMRGPPWRNWLKVVPLHLAALVVFKLRRRVGSFDPQRYLQEMAVNSDFRRVNGMVRLVLDCTTAQCDAIDAELMRLHGEGRIAFGAHRASAAIVTCVAPSIENHEHVHYVDGTEGGLWTAAKTLKARRKEGER